MECDKDLVLLKKIRSRKMITTNQIRSQILRKIQKIPSNKLGELNDFVTKLEQTTNKKDKILSFAGAWENIEEEIFCEITENLISNRQKHKRKANE